MKKWFYSDDRRELIGPCGCRVPNAAASIRLMQEHECQESG